MTGRFSSREIERATYSDVALRFLSGDTHPDHDTICAFRRQNEPLFMERLCQRAGDGGGDGAFEKVGNMSLEGSKVLANASKHCAVSYEHAGRRVRSWSWRSFCAGPSKPTARRATMGSPFQGR